MSLERFGGVCDMHEGSGGAGERGSTPVVVGSPLAVPLLGHLPWFLADRLAFLERCARTYGEVVKLNIGGETYLLTNPEDIKHVLVCNPDNYEKTPRLTSAAGRSVSGEGLLTASAGSHVRERRMLQPAFYRSRIAVFASTITSTAQETFDEWERGRPVEIGGSMAELARRVIIRTVFWKSFADRDGRLRGALMERQQYLDHVFFSLMPLAQYLPPWTWWSYRRAMRLIRSTIAEEITARRRAPMLGPDLLTALMRARYEDGSAMSDERISDEALTLLITGYESIGDGLAWTLYCLSQHPDVERQLSAEVSSVLAGRMPSVGDLYQLPYAAMVIAESLRLYPPSWLMVRIASKNDRLPSGALIPEGAKVYLCQYVMHRHPKFHSDPLRFDPNRFTEASKKERPPFAYFPFGGGARVCIGEHFAKLEMTLVLVMAMQRFKLILAPGQTIVPWPRMTLRPKNGLRMHVEVRR